MKLILNTVRKIDYDQAKEFTFGDTQSLQEQLAIAFLNPKNVHDLKITKDSHVKITNEAGSIVVKVLEDENIPEGSISMPVSIWANQITQVHENEIFYKNITVNVEPSNEAITKYTDLITKIRGE